ncbi:hypothetical protein NBRC116584_02620 [Hydrogenophaga sp. 5NK40-0174]
MGFKYPSEVPVADAQTLAEVLEEVGGVGAGQLASDQLQRMSQEYRASILCRPGAIFWRQLWPAAQARPEACRFGRSRMRKEAAIAGLWRPDATHGTAVDAGRRHRDEEAPIEAGVLRAQRLIAGCMVGCEGFVRQHGGMVRRRIMSVWPFSDMWFERYGTQIMYPKA